MMDGAAVGFLVSVSVAALLLGLGGILLGLGAKLGSGAGVPGYLMFLCGLWLMIVGVGGHGGDLIDHYGRPIDADHSYRAVAILVGTQVDQDGDVDYIFDEIRNLDEEAGEFRHILRKIGSAEINIWSGNNVGDCVRITPRYNGTFDIEALEKTQCGG